MLALRQRHRQPLLRVARRRRGGGKTGYVEGYEKSVWQNVHTVNFPNFLVAAWRLPARAGGEEAGNMRCCLIEPTSALTRSWRRRRRRRFNRRSDGRAKIVDHEIGFAESGCGCILLIRKRLTGRWQSAGVDLTCRAPCACRHFWQYASEYDYLLLMCCLSAHRIHSTRHLLKLHELIGRICSRRRIV